MVGNSGHQPTLGRPGGSSFHAYGRLLALEDLPYVGHLNDSMI
jgi:hypothetical protein